MAVPDIVIYKVLLIAISLLTWEWVQPSGTTNGEGWAESLKTKSLIHVVNVTFFFK